MIYRISTGFFFISLIMGFAVFANLTNLHPLALQIDPTSTKVSGIVTITVTYEEDIRVRGGPNAVYYPVVGTLPVGGVVEAIGKSLAGEWIMIIFPEANDGSGKGWVYAPLVTLSSGSLPVVEPPPTPVPVLVVTLDPSFISSLQPEATASRQPTFTAPPPLPDHHFTNPIDGAKGFSSGMIILLLGGFGVVGLVMTRLRKVK